MAQVTRGVKAGLPPETMVLTLLGVSSHTTYLTSPFKSSISFFFFLLSATPMAFGSSQVRRQIGATAASLHTPQPQQCQILNPEWGQGSNVHPPGY